MTDYIITILDSNGFSHKIEISAKSPEKAMQAALEKFREKDRFAKPGYVMFA